jgi:Protein of unknown function (DUF3631)
MTKPKPANRRDDAAEIRKALADRAADLAHHLLCEPNAAMSSKHELRFGNRGSLAVIVAGPKAGKFFDHEIGEGGDMLDLIQREYNCSFANALEFARDFWSGPVRTAAPRKATNAKQRAPAGKIVATYQYRDEAGAVLFEVVRFDPKDFRQRRPDPKRRGKWIWSTKDVRPVPYRLPDVIENRDKVLFIVEGERDVDRLWQLGIPATCNAGGAGKWREDLSEFFRGADVVVIPDRDPQKVHPKTGEPVFHPDGRPILPGQDHAAAVASSLHGIASRVRLLELWTSWPDMPLKGDVSDWIAHGGTAERLYALIEALPSWSPPGEHGEQAEPEKEESADTAELRRLAQLPPLQYERERKQAAERLGISRVAILDRLVQAEREHLGLDGDDDTGMQGRAISFPEPEPWPEPVDGAALLDDIASAIGAHVIMPDTSRDACALWAAHTFLLDCTMISPRLAITSPTRGCGKTTALDVMFQLVRRPLAAANISPSSTFRVVEGFHPTLLIDEADSFLRDNEELRGVLNSGHRKGGAVLRTVGDDHEPRSFSTYGACAIALIGQLPGTLADRSVPILLTRRKRDEEITPFRLDRVEHLVVLARKLARWTGDNEVAIAATEPAMPAGLYNRAADNWRPLLAIATVAGGNWPTRGQAAALKSIAADIDDASLLELLLGDIRDIFAKRAANEVEPADRIPSTVLAEALAEIEGRPWAEYGKNDKPITPGKLARLLKPLVIAPDSVRIDEKRTLKGYYLNQFEEAFSRYLDPEGASKPEHRNNADETGTSELFQSGTAETDVPDRKCEKSANDGPCSGVADRKEGQPGEHEVCEYCGRPGGNEVSFSDGPSARLHRGCEEPYRRRLDEGEPADDA